MTKLEYRPDIDGLRSIAVLIVILFHAGFSWIPGGYVGVDVFFVISGYLITSIICGEIKSTGELSFANFYVRRIRRLFPALFFVVILTCFFAFFIFSREDYSGLIGSALSAVFSLSNIFFWSESGYFDSESSIKPLLHTWSLSVEEQFYILWPSMLLAIMLWLRKWTFWTVCFLSLASLLACVAMMEVSPASSFYLTPFRVYEFGVGAALALSGRTYDQNSVTSKVLLGVGLLLIVYPALAFDENTPFPGLHALIPCLGAALCIYVRDAGVVSLLLSNRVSVYIGKISYSLYLVHWPIYVLYTYYVYREIGVVEKIGLVACTFVVAIAVYYLVENPMRQAEFWHRRRVYYYGVAPLVFAVSLVAYSSMSEDNSSVVDGVVLEQPKSVIEKRFVGCNTKVENAKGIYDFCRMGDPNAEPTVAVWGDSHASALSLGLDQVLEENHFAGIKLTEVGCAPIVGVTREVDGVVNSECAAFNDFVMQGILASDNIDTVILASRWTLQIESDRFDNREGAVERGEKAILLGKDRDGSWTRNMEVILDLYRDSMNKLVSSGKKVFVIYPIPEVGWHVPRTMHHRQEKGLNPQITTSYEVFQERNSRSYKFLDSIGLRGLSRLYPEKALCNVHVKGRCVASLENTPLYSDDDHLNGYGALLVARSFSEIFR